MEQRFQRRRWLTGVHPIKRRNTEAKYWELLKPSAKATSVTESLPPLSCTQAASIFLRKIREVIYESLCSEEGNIKIQGAYH
jgi:hypothetical protein